MDSPFLTMFLSKGISHLLYIFPFLFFNIKWLLQT